MQPIAAPLLQWFDANKRLLPFRQEPSAYHIWVSEIMLQQTRVAAAIPYYERFIAALPDPAALAGIGVQAVLDEPLPPAKHVFTHKIWELGGWRGTAPACALPDGYVWAAPEDLAEVYPVPNAFGAYVKAK